MECSGLVRVSRPSRSDHALHLGCGKMKRKKPYNDTMTTKRLKRALHIGLGGEGGEGVEGVEGGDGSCTVGRRLREPTKGPLTEADDVGSRQRYG